MKGIGYIITGLNSNGYRIMIFDNHSHNVHTSKKKANTHLSDINNNDRSVAIIKEMWKDVRVDPCRLRGNGEADSVWCNILP